MHQDEKKTASVRIEKVVLLHLKTVCYINIEKEW